MSAEPYRSSMAHCNTSQHAGSAHHLFSMPSVQAHTAASFTPMPGLQDKPCVDMYGDLPFGMFTLPNATLRGDEAYIFTSDGSPIMEQNADFLRKKKFLKPKLREDHHHLRSPYEVEQLVSLISRCDTGFFHWIMDSLPKVLIAEACGFIGSYLLPSSTTAPWADESLFLLGISRDRIVHHTDSDINARHLFIPTYFSGYNAHHNPEFMTIYRDTIRRAIESKPSIAKKRILIARKPGTKVRRIINHDEVVEMTTALGFETVYFEDLSLREQLHLSISAEAMIGAHGSGLCHSLFMDENSTLVELFPFERRQSCDCYEMLATIPRHRYHSIESSEDCEGDIVVSVRELRDMLRGALGV